MPLEHLNESGDLKVHCNHNLCVIFTIFFDNARQLIIIRNNNIIWQNLTYLMFSHFPVLVLHFRHIHSSLYSATGQAILTT